MLCVQQAQTKVHASPTARQRHFGGRRAGAASSQPMLAPWQVSLAMRTMGRDLAGPISISEVASLCRLSLCYFVRAFTNTVGVAPYAWFVQQRIMCAQRLLADTALPLVQVALECGFSDQAHFTKAFSKAAGMTPARWRRQICAS
ncbi:helix-turn-helix domain-containing protein [Sphingobium estronivorans]|uniref:helix-turn-helix domain-containing protein n=1 Tax=Sphingobium estronivorans TaxID=1577690 RepID=UPI001F0749A5|nr:AraC family transcriptional regulator [Sphingobium estronivorans]